MRSDVTTLIHLSSNGMRRDFIQKFAEVGGLVVIEASSLEDLTWLRSRLNKYIIVITDPIFNPTEIDGEAPLISLLDATTRNFEDLANSLNGLQGVRPPGL